MAMGWGRQWGIDIGQGSNNTNMDGDGSSSKANGSNLKNFKLEGKLNCAEYIMHRDKFDGQSSA